MDLSVKTVAWGDQVWQRSCHWQYSVDTDTTWLKVPTSRSNDKRTKQNGQCPLRLQWKKKLCIWKKEKVRQYRRVQRANQPCDVLPEVWCSQQFGIWPFYSYITFLYSVLRKNLPNVGFWIIHCCAIQPSLKKTGMNIQNMVFNN